MIRLLLFIPVILLNLLAVLPVYALLSPHDIILDDSLGVIYPLDEVVYLAAKVHDTSLSSPVIKLENFQQGYASSVENIMTLVPGLSLSTGRKNSLNLRIRGSNSQSILVLLNGRPINSGYFGTIDLSMIPLSTLEEIQVEKGPSSVAYGPGGLGGVVNFITTKNENPNSITYNSYIATSPGYETDSQSSFSRVWKNNSIFLSFGRKYSEAYRLSLDFKPVPLENGYDRDNSDVEENRFLMDFSRKANERFRYAFTLNGYFGEKGVPGSIYENQFWRYKDISRIGGLFSWEYRNSNLKRLLGSFFLNNYSDRLISFQNRNYDYNNIYYDSKINNYTTGFDLSRIVDAEDYAVHYGLKSKLEKSERSYEDQPNSLEKYQMYTISPFIESKKKNLQNGTLLLGAGYHSNWNDWSDELDVRSEFTLQTNYTRPINDNLFVHFALGRNVFFPTMHNLFSSDRGNSNLKPEIGTKLETGFLSSFHFDKSSSVSIGVVTYYQRTAEQIVLDPVSDRFENLDVLHSWGIEGEFKFTYRNLLAININGGKIKWNEDELVNYLELSDYTASSNIVFSPGKKTVLQFDYIYNSKRNTINHIGIPTDMEAYSLLNGAFSYRFPKWLSYTLSAENLMDVEYCTSYGYPAPGKMYWVKLDLKIEK